MSLPDPLELDALEVRISELLVATADSHDPSLDRRITDVLLMLRKQLRMDVVFVSEFVDGQRMFRFVHGGEALGIHAGDAAPLEEVFVYDLAVRAAQKRRSVIVMLDQVTDPHNVGAILRSASAFGASGVVFTRGCARISNGKLLRAAAGSLFRMPCLENLAPIDVVRRLHSERLPLYALASDGDLPLSQTPLSSSCALAVGNEGAGLSAELLTAAQTLRIPTRGVESLNAAVACSIALFEAARQRGLA